MMAETTSPLRFRVRLVPAGGGAGLSEPEALMAERQAVTGMIGNQE